MKLTQEFQLTRNRATPLIFIATSEPANTIHRLMDVIEASAPVITWDAFDGFRPAINRKGEESEAGLAALKAVENKTKQQLNAVLEPGPALGLAPILPADTVLIMHNLARAFDGAGAITAIQGVWNLRDLYKNAPRRTLVMLGPSPRLPVEIRQDVVVLFDPRPDDDERKAIIAGTFHSLSGEGLTNAGVALPAAINITRGLSPFQVEQLSAIALDEKKGINLDVLGSMTRATIEQTPGAYVERGTETFDQVGGLGNAKRVITRQQKGPFPVKLFVKLEELDKLVAGASTSGPADNTGVSQYIVSRFLDEMEGRAYSGMIAVGGPGTGKSLLTMTAGNTFGVRTLVVDPGRAKQGEVGSSERNINEIFDMIYALAGEGGAYFIANCNRVDPIPPELISRFSDGIYVFDLPSPEECASIWPIQLAKYGIAKQPIPPHEGWSGRNIRNCCRLAWRHGVTLMNAAEMIVPAARADAKLIAQIREAGHDRWLSASYPGPFQDPSTKRKVDSVPVGKHRDFKFGNGHSKKGELN